MKNKFLLTAMLLLGIMSMTAQTIEREWVDLALPSGTLWAAQAEEGFYNYPDAFKSFGVHMPTKAQWVELLNSVEMEKYDKNHLALKGKNGNFILIPLNGWIFKNGKPQNVGNFYGWAYSYYDKNTAWCVMLNEYNFPDSGLWTYKNSYKTTIILVNK